jgi:hypothetical protein
MTMTDWIIIAAVLAAVAIIAIRCVVAYRAATGTPWQRILLIFRNSETILWARIQVFGGVLIGLGDYANTLVHDSTVSDAVRQILDPKLIPFYVIGIGALTEVIRRHRTEKDENGAITTPPPLPKG